LVVSFDGSSSSDTSGIIVAYQWEFGDGTTGSGKAKTHTYELPGEYRARLTVTDDDGAKDSTTWVIQVNKASLTASFTTTPTSGEAPLSVDFDASGSFDPGGESITYAWSFGDGSTGVGVVARHTYYTTGIYTVLLTVRNGSGDEDQSYRTIAALRAPRPGNAGPVASFTASPASGPAPLAVSFNGSGSSDSDGSIVSYAWNFGDGGSASGAITSHTYNSAGTYTAQLTVTDDDGATDVAIRTINLSADPVANNPPMASFTATPSSGLVPLQVEFDPSASTDSNGSIKRWDWNFGDGSTLPDIRGIRPTHVYAAVGTYTATLTVTDDDGITDDATQQIEVTADPLPEDLYVNANNGSDTTGDGTQGSPYKTITKALDMVDASNTDHTIHVAAGIYNTELGEKFPLELNGMVNGIALVGEGASRDDVKIAGGIEVRWGATLSSVSIYSHITLMGESLLFNCVIDSYSYSLAISFSSSTLQACVIKRGKTLIFSGGGVIVDNEFYEPLDCGGAVRIERNTFYSTGVTWHANVGAIRENVFVSGYIDVRGGSVVIENNLIESDSFTNCIAVTGIAVADLGGGLLGSVGGNVFIGSPGRNILQDNRDPYSGSLHAKGNTWTDPQPSGTVSGPVDSSPNYSITNEGNSIIFSD
jgi:PKD repeat protein